MAEDRALVEALRRGDPAAAPVVWRRYSARVRGVIRRAMGPNADVEDLVQEVFLRLFRRIDTLRSPDALTDFVLAIAYRVVRWELRHRWLRRWLTLGSGKEPLGDAAVESDLEAREAVLRLYRMLDRLRPESRVLFVLRFVDQAEVSQIADILGVSVSTAKRRLARVTRQVSILAKADPVLAAYCEGSWAGAIGGGTRGQER